MSICCLKRLPFFSSVPVSHQAEERAVQNSEQLLADLRRRSTSIAPLKLRRNNPNRPITVESLCDCESDKVEHLNLKLLSVVYGANKTRSNIFNWEVSVQVLIHTDVSSLNFEASCRMILFSYLFIIIKASLSRGEKLTLKSNSDTENWDVISTDGATKTFPGVCFQIPPPDPEAIDKVDL